MFKYRPLNKKVLISPHKVEEQTSGILILESSKEKQTKGTVIAVNNNSDLKEGNVVVYSRHAGQEMSLDGENYLMMSDDDVYFVINE